VERRGKTGNHPEIIVRSKGRGWKCRSGEAEKIGMGSFAQKVGNIEKKKDGNGKGL